MNNDEKELLFIYLFVDRKIKLISCRIKYFKEITGLDYDISHIIEYLKEIDVACTIPGCNNRRKLDLEDIKKNYFGFQLFCSRECYVKNLSLRQIGDKNSSHKMSLETFESMRKNNSEFMKSQISKGLFKPNITNSWAKSKCSLIINDTKRFFRSSWEAFFNLVNPHLEYEKLRIPYIHDGNNHTYIVDFIDDLNRIIYEIKPSGFKNFNKNSSKEVYAIEWCRNNDYSYTQIDESWFKINFPINKHLLNDQEEGNDIKRKLKKFNESKKNN